MIAVIWIWFLLGSISMGLRMPYDQSPVLLGPGGVDLRINATALCTIFFVFCLLVGFFFRGWHQLDIALLRRLADRVSGAGSYDGFIYRLQPATLFTLVLLIAGVTGVVTTFASTQRPQGYFAAGFALSCGLGILAAHVLSTKFPPRLLRLPFTKVLGSGQS